MNGFRSALRWIMLAMLALASAAPTAAPQTRAEPPDGLLAPASDVSFSLSLPTAQYAAGDHIPVGYRVLNLGKTALFVPRGNAETVCLDPRWPHFLAWFENSVGQTFKPGYGVSCAHGVEPRLRTSDLVRRVAIALKPGEHIDGTIELDSTMFGGLPPGTYRIDGVLRGWTGNEFEWADLRAMGIPLLQGEATASVDLTLSLK